MDNNLVQLEDAKSTPVSNSLIHPEYKQLFFSILDNNVDILANLDDYDKNIENKVSRKDIKRFYMNIRFKIQSGQELTPTEILYVGIAVNIALINLKNKERAMQLTIDNFEKVIQPQFSGLLEFKEDGEELVSHFYEFASQELNSKLPKLEKNDN